MKKAYFCEKCQAIFRGNPDKAPICGRCNRTTVDMGVDEDVEHATDSTMEEIRFNYLKEHGHLENAEQSQGGAYQVKQPLPIKISVTSGYNFEGFRITEYLDFCNASSVLGTGFLSSISASVADFFGTESSAFETKLNQAKSLAEDSLKRKAFNLGANAIIGASLNITTFSGGKGADIIGIVMTGTAVKIEAV